jgi:two-component system uhpT operon response regulator UhpA
MLRIALVDDHPLFRSGIRDLIARTSDLELTVEVGTAKRALQAAAQHDIGVFVVDLKLPDRNGISLMDDLHFHGARCLVLTMYDDADHVVRALAAGAGGYATKRDPPDLILEAIRTVASGGIWISPLLKPSAPIAPGIQAAAR